MSSCPPISARRAAAPPRSDRPGWPVALAVVVALTLAGCRGSDPPPAPADSQGSRGDPGAIASGSGSDDPGLGGLVVATGGNLFVSDESGILGPIGGPGPAIRGVSAGGGRTLANDATGNGWLAADLAASPPIWSRVIIPTGAAAEPGLATLDPTGRRLAVVLGSAQEATFDLDLLNLDAGAPRTIHVERGLNGPPIWIGPATIGLNVIRGDQAAGFTAVDLVTGSVDDLPSFGSSLAATADGSVVALDDAASGDVLIGARADMTADGISQMTWIASPAGSGPDALTLSPDGRRLAIVRRNGDAVTIEIFAQQAGAWAIGRRLVLAGDPSVSLAWSR